MRVAVIDIGTNSIRLMLADKTCAHFTVIKKVLRTVRLGEKITDGIITKNASNRAVDALNEFKSMATKLGAQKLLCFATSCVRDAANKDVFLREVKTKTGLCIDVLSGKDEADMGFLGAVKEGSGGIIDIGGGSTEIIFGKNNNITYKESFDIGAVRYLYKYGHTHALTVSDFTRIREDTLEALKELKYIDSIKPVYGIGGTATCLCSIKLGLKEYSSVLVQSQKMTAEEIAISAKQLFSLSFEQRLNIVGLDKRRADIIPFGAIILDSAMEILNLKELIISDADNLEGYLHKSFDLNC